jgi:hypothetical protein
MPPGRGPVRRPGFSPGAWISPAPFRSGKRSNSTSSASPAETPLPRRPIAMSNARKPFHTHKKYAYNAAFVKFPSRYLRFDSCILANIPVRSGNNSVCGKNDSIVSSKPP